MAVCSDSWRICCEAAAEEIKSIPYKYGSDRERAIFESLSTRYITKESVVQSAAQERAVAEQREYHDLYRRDALMLMHPDDEAQVNQLLSQGIGLRPEQYRAGLEKIYPMLYLAVCMEMFGPDRVGD
jgi:hypothetical protein